MKTLAHLAFVFALASQSALADHTVRKDPETDIRYYLTETEVSEAPLVLGWSFDSWAAEKIDFDRLEKDEEYASQVVNDYESSLVQVVADNATSKVLATYYAAQIGRVCYRTNFFGANHCYAGLKVLDERTAVLTVNLKWFTAHAEVLRYGAGANGLEIQAATGNVMPIVENDLLVKLDQVHAAQANYIRDRDSLVTTLNDVTVVAGSRELTLKVSVDAYVPKGMHDDSFAVENQVLEYKSGVVSGFRRLVLSRP